MSIINEWGSKNMCDFYSLKQIQNVLTYNITNNTVQSYHKTQLTTLTAHHDGGRFGCSSHRGDQSLATDDQSKTYHSN